MKQLTLLLLVISIVGCNDSKNHVTFSGKITDKNSDSIVISNTSYSKTIQVNEDGSFSDTLNVKTGLYTFGDGTESTTIFLKNGFDINMTLDTKMFDETIKYSGVGSETSNYLATKVMNSEKVSGGDTPTLFTLDETAFLEKINEIKNAKDTFFNESKLENEFTEREKKNLKYDHLLYIQNYPNYHKYYAKKEEFKTSEGFLDPIKDIDFTNDKDYTIIPSYKSLVKNHYLNKLHESENKKSVFEELINIKGVNIKNDLAKSLAYAYNITPNNKHHEIYYNSILRMSNDNEFKENLTEKYKSLQKLSKGQPSPKFSNYENYSGGKTSLDDLKGKYVYIDVWATWCGPCKREIPFLKEVESKYHGKNIEFVSISIDTKKSHTAWKKMVDEKKLGGIQLFADNDWNSKFITDYGIEGIPRFLLIDPNGNIVSANAPRPSSKKLITLLNKEKI